MSKNKQTEYSTQAIKNLILDNTVSPPVPREGVMGQADNGSYYNLKVNTSSELIIDPTNLDTRYAKLDLTNQPFQPLVDSTTALQVLAVNNDVVLNIDTTNNKIEVDRLEIRGDNVVNRISYPLSGLSAFQQTLNIVVDGANIYMETEAVGGGDIAYVFDEERHILDCTTGAGTGGKAQVALVPGTATQGQINYVCVEPNGAGVAILTTSTSIPTGTFAWHSIVVLQDTATVTSHGPISLQRNTEALKHGGRGQLSYMREKLRWLGPRYVSGVVSTLDVGVALNLLVSGGIVFQLHRQSFPALNVVTDGITGANISGVGTLAMLENIHDLNDIDELEDGSTIGVNKYFSVTIWATMSSDDQNGNQSKLFFNLPTGVYNSETAVISDSSNFDIRTADVDFNNTAFLVSRVTMKRTPSGNTPVGAGVYALTGSPMGTLGGGAGSTALTEFSDNNFHIYNDIDPTKIVDFDASAITTGIMRTITMADTDVDLADIALNTTHRGLTNNPHAVTFTQVGADPVGTDNSTDVTLAGTLDYLTLSGQEITLNDIDLTTDVTGTLPLANGGTGATAFTSGSIPFSNGTILTQDNSNLFWDDANNRLGIGTNSPISALEIPGSTFNSSAKFGSYEIQSYAVNNAWLGDNIFFGASGFQYRADGYGTLSYFRNGGFAIRTAPFGTAGSTVTPTEVFTILENGRVGIGKTLPSAKLHISGTTNEIQQIIQGAVGQTANLTEWQNSSGTRLASVSSGGFFGVGRDADFGSVIYAQKDQSARTSINVRNVNSGTSSRTGFQAESDAGNVFLFHYSSGYTDVISRQNRAVFGVSSGSDGFSLVATNTGQTIKLDTNLVTITNPLHIIGSSNEIQQIIQGYSTQTNNLTEWQNSSGTALTVVDENGHFGVGTSPGTNKIYAKYLDSDTSGNFVSVLGESRPNPSASSSGAYIGLRGISQSISSNANNITGSLRGLTGLAQHDGGGTLTVAYGGQFQVSNAGTGTINTAIGFNLNVSKGAGSINAAYGISIDSVTAGTFANYAIYTNAGLNRFGDRTEIVGTLKIGDSSDTAQAGDLRYNTSTNKHQGYDGTSWNDLY